MWDWDPIIQVEVTTCCNSACIFCPREEVFASGKRTLGDISPTMASLLVERLSELTSGYRPLLSFGGFGEPTCYPDLMKLVCNSTRACEGFVRLDTNAILLKDELADQIIELGCVDKLVLSLILPTEELYKKHKRRNNFKAVKNNMISFLQKKGDRKPSTEVRIIHMPETAPFFEEAREFWKKHLNENDKFTKAKFENWAGLIEPKNPPAKLVPCKYVAQLSGKHLSINKDGYASFCCYAIAMEDNHPFVVGNIKDASISELLEKAGKRTRQLRREHRKGIYTSNCATCSERG